MKNELCKQADNLDELLLVLDENGNSTGKFLDRNTVHENLLFHNEAVLWIVNPKTQEALLQRRSANKKSNPNKLGLCAGHVVGNQTIKKTLKDEAKSEIGLDVSGYQVQPLCREKRQEPRNNYFQSHFYILAEIPLDKFTIQKCELSELLYMHYRELRERMRGGDTEIAMKWSSAYERIFKKFDEIFAKTTSNNLTNRQNI